MLFNDDYFLSLLKKELPKVAFCSRAGVGEDQKVQINRFLVSLAKELAT